MKSIRVKSAPWWDAQLDWIGKEKMPIIQIDNFFPEPQILLEDAKQKNFIANALYFPGIRATVPQAYFRPVMQGLSEILKGIFQYKSGLDVQEAHYSLTTTTPKDLNMIQRLPHIDGGNDMKIALLHYLCGSDHGGTGFYKQLRTGFETVSSARFSTYEKAVQTDHEELGEPEANYFCDSDERFSRIYKIEAKFNRAILYFGLNLHSVLIGTKTLTQNPATGRLTINTFMSPI